MPEEKKMYAIIEVFEPIQMRMSITDRETHQIATKLLNSLGLIIFDKIPFQNAIKDVFNIGAGTETEKGPEIAPLSPDPAPDAYSGIRFKAPKIDWTPEEDLVIQSAATAAKGRNAYFCAFPESKRTKNAAYTRFYTLKNRNSHPPEKSVSSQTPLREETPSEAQPPDIPKEGPQDTISQEISSLPPLLPAATKKPQKKPQESLPAHVNSGKLPAKVGAPVKIVKGIYDGQTGIISKIKEGQALVDVGEEGKRIETWCLIKDEIVVTGCPEPVPHQTELHGIKLYDTVIQIKGFGAKQSGRGKVIKIEGNKLRVKFATVEKMLYPEEVRVKSFA